jgi:hypothetical protein
MALERKRALWLFLKLVWNFTTPPPRRIKKKDEGG